MAKGNPFKIQEGSIRDAKVSSFIRYRQSGDYLDLDWIPKAEHLGRFFASHKIKNLILFFSVFIVLLWGRAMYLQIIKGDYFRLVAEGNRIRSEVIPANRGLIYDRFGNLLVKNVSYFFLYIKPDLLPSDEAAKEKIFDELASTLVIDKNELKNRFYNNKKDIDKILVYENVPYDAAIKLMIQSEDQDSLEIAYEPRRQYFVDFGLSPTLGYLGDVNTEDLKDKRYNYHSRIGKDGLELTYEEALKGRDGFKQIEVDALFREKSIISRTDPIDGSDLILTIDSKAQAKLTEIMSQNASRTGKNKMAAVVLDAQDGGVLAIGSLPTFDNNIFTTVLNTSDYEKIISDPNTPMLNRVVAGTYPLGSVFKSVVGSAALEEKIITPQFKVNSVGGINVGGNFFPDWRPGGHGSTDIYWAIADSVNTFFYSIGGGNNQWLQTGLGVDKIVDYAKRFGLSKTTGIDLPSEAEGFLPSKEWKQKTFNERWYLGDTYNLSIGQGYLLATPLQAAVIMSYFANNGTVYQPHFVKEIKQNDQTEVSKPQVALTNIISSDNLKVMREAFRLTVTDGTAQSLQSVAVPVAGKTGTAQFNRNKTPHSWFVAFAPYDNAKIVMAVIVEEGGDTGLAVTVVRQFMEWYFSK